MEISGLSGYFDGYEWHNGPFTFQISGDRIREIYRTDDKSGDYHIPGHILSLPFTDGHTHLIFGGDRSFELSLKLAGKTYPQILESGGGILNTVKATRAMDDNALLELVMARLDLMLAHGTMVVEAKSGYGLSAEHELRLLEILKTANQKHEVDIISTYCGAHALTGEVSRQEYVEEVISIIPEIVGKSLASSTDVFCDRGAFNVDETREILKASIDNNLPVRVHAEELEYTGIGKIAASEFNALSVDHVLLAKDSDFDSYVKHGTTAMFMPAATIGLFTNQTPSGWQDKGVNIGLGTDFNPNNMVVSMQTAIRLAVYLYRMQPIDAFKAATTGSYYGLTKIRLPKIQIGSKANFVIMQGNSMDEVVTRFDQNLIRMICKDGKIVKSG